MKLDKEILTNLQSVDKELINIIVKELKRVGANASGRLIDSIKAEYKATAESINLIINSQEYIDYIESGRKPGIMPPIEPIKEWLKYKSMPQSAAYPIAINIFKYGIKPRPIFKAIDNNITDKVNNSIDTSVIDFIEQQITPTLNK